jgi:integrase
MGVVWCATQRRLQMKRTKMTRKHLCGISELEPGLYQIRVQEVDSRTGTMIDVRKRVRCETLEEVVQEQAKLRAEALGDQGLPDPGRVRLEDYARSWLSGRLPTLKPSTATRYADTLDRIILPVLGSLYLNAITPEDALRWFKGAAAKKAASTANGYLRVFRVMMSDAAAQYRLPCDPTARLRAIPERGEKELESDDPVNLLTVEEMARFMAALKEGWPQWYSLAFTQFATASRFSEVSALRWEDIDWQRGIIRIRRGNWRTVVSTAKIDRRRRNPALTDDLRQVLTEWRERIQRSHRHADSGWVFPSQAGKPHHNASGMGKAFAACLSDIGVGRRFSSHGLRRTANDLIRRVASGEVARAITGHVTERMTEHYSHVDVGEKKAAVEGMLQLVRGGASDRENGTSRHDADGETGTNLGNFLGNSGQNRQFRGGAEVAGERKAR